MTRFKITYVDGTSEVRSYHKKSYIYTIQRRLINSAKILELERPKRIINVEEI